MKKSYKRQKIKINLGGYTMGNYEDFDLDLKEIKRKGTNDGTVQINC